MDHENQRQIVLGTLLGHGYICNATKNPYFCMRHKIKDLPWAQAKAEEMGRYSASTPWKITETNCVWRSVCHPTFCEFRDLCYLHNKKKISMEWLDQLNDTALAIWYGDSGELLEDGRASLQTQQYSQEDNQIIEKYFNEVNIPCKATKRYQNYFIAFTPEATEKIISMVSPFLPKSRYSTLIKT